MLPSVCTPSFSMLYHCPDSNAMVKSRYGRAVSYLLAIKAKNVLVDAR